MLSTNGPNCARVLFGSAVACSTAIPEERIVVASNIMANEPVVRQWPRMASPELDKLTSQTWFRVGRHNVV
jgi:hypothetical protein